MIKSHFDQSDFHRGCVKWLRRGGESICRCVNAKCDWLTRGCGNRFQDEFFACIEGGAFLGRIHPPHPPPTLLINSYQSRTA